MKEFVEKLIGRLEEESAYARYSVNTDGIKSVPTYKAKEIVNQLAEEYNNGWVPCSERLPEENGKYIAYYHKWSDGNYLPKFDETEIRILRYRNNDWIFPTYVNTEAEKDSHREVIAWQPLPAPFKKGSE